MHVQDYPAMINIYPDGTNLTIDLSELSRRNIVNILKDPSTSLNDITKREANTVSPLDQDYTNSSSPDQVHQEDMEHTIWYSLFREIPFNWKLHNDSGVFNVLKDYINLLSVYAPLSEYKTNGTQFLRALSQRLEDSSTISPKDYKRLFNVTMHQFEDVFATDKPFRWIGCYSSDEHYRRYPCGLWTLFHALTTNYAIANDDNADQAMALRVVRDYVKHFFICIECREHFMKMAEMNQLEEVKDRNEAVLWLWKAHNEVNARLAHDTLNQDPMFKKIQYPSREHCPTCRNENGEWNEEKVLKYLKQKYGVHETVWNKKINPNHASVVRVSYALTVFLTTLVLTYL